jgi:hypothetical protein
MTAESRQARSSRDVHLSSFAPLVAAVLLPVLAAADARLPAQGSRPAVAASMALPVDVPGGRLPIVRERWYRMAGRVRPLLFWVGRDHVGDGLIVWRRHEDGTTAFAFLTGSDPERAPRGLNRWGFIAERVHGPDGETLGLISESNERSQAEVASNLTRDGRRFKTIRTRVADGVSISTTGIVATDRTLTLRDVQDAIVLVRTRPETARRTLALSHGVRPGFLAVVAELMHEGVGAAEAGRTEARPGRTLSYVYGSRLYRLSVRSESLIKEFQIEDRTYTNVVRSRFETRRDEGGEPVRFEVIYGTTGTLAEVPLVIRYQPNWWLEVELLLED